MIKRNIYSSFFLVPLLVGLLAMFVVSGCSDDDEELAPGFGHVQFRIQKSASYDKETATRGVQDKLEYLNDAKKIKVILQYNGATVEQTLLLNSYNDNNAEFGLRSEKLRLLAGDYSLVGFYLYDKLDKVIYAGPSSGNGAFTVITGGLHLQLLPVDAVSRGMVAFKLIKSFVSTRTGEGGAYPFSNIKGVSFTVKNLFTQELTSIEHVAVKYMEDFNEEHQETAYAVCDTVVWLKAGSYQVVSYSTYSDKRFKNHLETASVPSSKTFIVKDNEKTENAEVPVRLSQTAEYIKDYIALKAIWEKMDGVHWSYVGEEAAPGCNWNFDKDIDLWGEQPGVQLMGDGRVASISLAGFGAIGNVPDEIGQLTELRILSLGTHSEQIGGRGFNNVNPNLTDEQRKMIRMDYDTRVLAKDPREGLSDILKDAINSNPDMKPIKSRIQTKDVQIGNLTNGITGISRAMMRLVNLERFDIANAPITTANFFVDIHEDSPYYDEQVEYMLSWENLKALLDIEIYNCPKLEQLPLEMLTKLPEVQSLNIACNPNIKDLKEDWSELINGNCGDKIQILYMGYNRMEETPEYEDLKKMVKLGLLDLTNCGIKIVHPFGREVNLVKFYLDYNEISTIEAAADGYFFGYDDVESFSVSHNKLKKVPDIFKANSQYVMGSVDYSFNQIDGFENGDAHKGINTNSLNLSYNKLETFPGVLFKTGSPITELNLSGNGMKSIPKGTMTGKKPSFLKSIDLTYNKLTDLPADFYADNVPYLYGIDLSYNSFSKFPYEPLDVATLNVIGVRHQRDEQGNRTLREWPTGIYKCPSLTRFFIGGNDLRKVDDTISPYIQIFDIKDNPNISIDLSGVCAHIRAGLYFLIYDKTQDIRGCDALDLDK